jgi:Fic family protein
MSDYIHELPEWPRFTWDHQRVAARLSTARHKQGLLLGRMGALGFKVKEDAVLLTLTADVLKSSEIEGETLDAGQVRSSLARRLGIDIGGLKPPTATSMAWST